MDYDSFIEKYAPVENTFDSQAGFDGMLFETFGSELDFVSRSSHVDMNRVWSLRELDDEKLVIQNGFYHLPDCVGYFVASVPYTCKKGQVKILLDQVDGE